MRLAPLLQYVCLMTLLLWTFDFWSDCYEQWIFCAKSEEIFEWSPVSSAAHIGTAARCVWCQTYCTSMFEYSLSCGGHRCGPHLHCLHIQSCSKLQPLLVSAEISIISFLSEVVFKSGSRHLLLNSSGGTLFTRRRMQLDYLCNGIKLIRT